MKVKKITFQEDAFENVKTILSWDSNNDGDDKTAKTLGIFYKIAVQKYLSLTLLGNFDIVAKIEGKNEAILDSLEPNTLYEVKVCAYNNVGESLYSDVCKFKTAPSSTSNIKRKKKRYQWLSLHNVLAVFFVFIKKKKKQRYQWVSLQHLLGPQQRDASSNIECSKQRFLLAKWD